MFSVLPPVVKTEVTPLSAAQPWSVVQHFVFHSVSRMGTTSHRGSHGRSWRRGNTERRCAGTHRSTRFARDESPVYTINVLLRWWCNEGRGETEPQRRPEDHPVSRDLERCKEHEVDSLVEEAFEEAFDICDDLADGDPALPPTREDSGGLVDNVLIVDDSTPTEVESDLDAWFDLVGGDDHHDRAGRRSPPTRAHADIASQDLPSTALPPARPGVYARTVRDVGPRDSVVDVLIEYLGEGASRPRGTATPKPKEGYRRVPVKNGQGWTVERHGRERAVPRPDGCLTPSPLLPPESPSEEPQDLDGVAFDDLVVGGDCGDADVYRSPVPEIRITSVDLAVLGWVASAASIEYLETAVEILRGIADDSYGAGRHKTVLRASAAREALAVARPVGEPWVMSTLVQDAAGDLGGFIDLGMHPSLRRLRAGVGRESLEPLLEQTAMFIVRSAQNVYLESFLGQSPVQLVADVAGLARFFWSMLPLELVLGRGECGDAPLVFNVAFNFNLIKNGDGQQRRSFAVSFDVGDGSRTTDKEEFLPRGAFHHAIICRAREDHSFMDFELYPRSDLEVDDDGHVIGPDGGRYPIDLPGVMSHLRI